jgi:mannose/fructose/N-acetylgalactosamine-specific phosphotransferase system component IIC
VGCGYILRVQKLIQVFVIFCCSSFPFLLGIYFSLVRMTVLIIFPLGDCKSVLIFGGEWDLTDLSLIGLAGAQDNDSIWSSRFCELIAIYILTHRGGSLWLSISFLEVMFFCYSNIVDTVMCEYVCETGVKGWVPYP